ncbi:MAG: hypothetical protein HRF49_06275 [bacterium]|jgi:hypothetical protein
MRAVVFFLILFATISLGQVSRAEKFDWEPNPGKDWVFSSEYGVESVSFRSGGYSNLQRSLTEITFRLSGIKVQSPQLHKLGGAVMSELLLKPDGDYTQATIRLSGIADGFSINTVGASRAFPNNSSVVAAITGLRAMKGGGKAPDDEFPAMSAAPKNYGDYELPEFERKYKYSDALVTLHLRGASIEGVLAYLSLLGNISIILDPYWNQEPTGTDRPPVSGGAAGGGGGQGIGTGGGAGGFSGFGEGLITIDLNKVPFDFALDLVITSAGLTYFEIR